MVIHRSDRVSDVLRQDESLIDVFVALSPAFAKLRNPALRRVMSRLVTVEQAARMASVDADELVARLNGAPAHGQPRSGGAGDLRAERVEPAPVARAEVADARPAVPAALRAIADALRVEVDVREDLRSGQEPFSRIMAARRELPPGGALRVRAIFEPVPLYAVMAKQGLAHHTEPLGPEDWSVWFYPSGGEAAASHAARPPARESGADQEADPTGENVVVLDVRDLEPPEPMVRTLAALESLPPEHTLVQVNVRVPQFLLPRLRERGFVYEIREQGPDLVRVFIRRAP